MARTSILVIVVVFVCGGIFTAGCGKKGESPTQKESLTLDRRGYPPRGGPIVARYGDKTVTQKELEYEIAQLPPDLLEKAKTFPGLQSYLNNYVNRQLILAEIESKPVDPKIERQARLYRESLLIDKYLDRELKKRIVTERKAKKHYEEHKDQFKSPQQVRVANILIKAGTDASPEDRKAARERAEEILKRLEQGEDFASLAREFSEDEVTAKRGGDLSYVPQGRMPPELEAVAFAMEKEGEISGVVESRLGFHILKFLGKKNPQQVEYEQVREQIIEHLGPVSRREAYQKYLGELREKKKVRIENSTLIQMIAKDAMEKTVKELGIAPAGSTAPVGEKAEEEPPAVSGGGE